MIEPRTLKGFRDFLPEDMEPRERLIDIARDVYRSYGFRPIDTPVLEYLEILTGKGSDETDRLMYSFQDHGGRPVGMRFDLTVPLARFVAQYHQQLGMPFKRYHIAKVWRGENTHRGRYREFMQCDFDTIGTLSIVADTEMVLVIHDLLLKLGIEKFQIRINNRKVLNGLLDRLGLAEHATAVLRSLDKLAKIGPQGVGDELREHTPAQPEQIAAVLELSQVGAEPDRIWSTIDRLVGDNALGQEGAVQLKDVVQSAQAAGVAPQRLGVDVSIARGLDYYTGTVVETLLDDLPQIGSVCSGGRYDNLVGAYSNQLLPGVGASLGLDRLLAALEELGWANSAPPATPVFVPFFDAQSLPQYLALAARIRQAGWGVEVYPEPKRLGQQLKYADRRGFRVAVIQGSDEIAQQTCQVKDLRSGATEQIDISQSLEPLRGSIERILAGSTPPAN